MPFSSWKNSSWLKLFICITKVKCAKIKVFCWWRWQKFTNLNKLKVILEALFMTFMMLLSNVDIFHRLKSYTTKNDEKIAKNAVFCRFWKSKLSKSKTLLVICKGILKTFPMPFSGWKNSSWLMSYWWKTAKKTFCEASRSCGLHA